MNKFAKSIILILLVLALVFAVVACNNDTTGNNSSTDGQHSDSGAVPVNNPVDKTAVFSRITTGLTLADGAVEKQNKRHVKSCYEVIVNQINLTVTYEADYDFTRIQDSEIMLKLFENQYERNTLFVYYYAGTLYYEYDGEKCKIENFGGTSTYEVFFQLMQSFDMESYFFTEDFAETFNSVSLFAESSNMSIRSISDTEERIEIANVNLDRTKNNVNKFIKQMFGKATLGTKLDAVSTAILGFKLSDIGEVEIGLFNASNIQVILRDGVVTDFDITFSGTQSNNVSTYYFDVSYSTSEVQSRVTLNKYDDPELNVYKTSHVGEQAYSGTMYVPALDTEFAVSIYGNLSTGDNNLNNFLVDVRVKTDESLEESDPHYIDTSIAYLYYINGTLYINIDGLERYYIGNGVDLKSLGFPTVSTTELNVSQQLGSVMTDLINYFLNDLSLEAIMGSIEFDWEETTLGITTSEESLIDPESPLGILLANCESDGDIFTITLDDDFVGAAVGDNKTDIVEWLAAQIGMDGETLERIIGEDFFADYTIVLKINMATGDIYIEFNTGDGTLFNMNIAAMDIPETGVVVPTPKDFRAGEYIPLEIPDNATLHVEGEIRMQGKSEVDMSKFMGAFLGDVTGANTPYIFEVKDRFYMDIYVWNEGDVANVKLKLWDNPVYTGALSVDNITSDPMLELVTSSANSDMFLVDYKLVGYKYQISRAGLLEAFNDLLGEGNLFSYDNVMDILRTITSNSMVLMNEDHIAFTIAPYAENGITVDPIFEYIGVDSMIADLKAQILFDDRGQEILPVNEYSIPEPEALVDLAFTSMYEAAWHDNVDVAFPRDNAIKNFKLTFQGESARLITGKYYYVPEAKLFGQVITYAMVLTDTINGTKAIDRLESSKLIIDPSVENAIPTKINVIYDDGTLGEQRFTIVDFPYTNDNINYALAGAEPKNYEIIIGYGSINEVRFTLPVEILNRVVVPYEFRNGIPEEPKTEEEKENWFNAYVGYGEGDENAEIPIVKVVTIDPYDYSLKKMANASYDPIGTSFIVYFQSAGSSAIVFEEVADFDWGFDESLITYRGGSYYCFAYYNTIKIAMRVDITAKVVDYIQIVGERPGNYTIDSLIESSYYIPVETDDRAEVRIYFKTGHYRIVGTMPEGYEQEDPLCDGYYPYPLVWKYTKATNISMDSTINPLDYGLTNMNSTQFGDNIVGKQNISLKVYSPSRRLANLADNVHAITYLAIDAITGDILEDETFRESVRVSSVGLGNVGGTFDYDGAYFILDPYATGEGKRLPSYITMQVEYASEIIRRAYHIEWVESTIIDADGYIKNPTADENLLVATGWIGENDVNRQLVTIIIHNLSGKYDRMIIIDPNTGKEIEASTTGDYVITINPYDNYTLPTSFTLEFHEDDGSKTQYSYATDWQIDLGNGEEPLPEGYQFAYSGGVFTLTTYVEANPAAGILAQKVDLIVAVMEKVINLGRIYGLSSEMTPDNDTMDYFTVNPYSTTAKELEDALLAGDAIGVSYKDGTKQNGGLPVEWNNLDEALRVLRSEGGTINYPDEVFTLTGYVHRFSTALEQPVSVSFRVLEKQVRSIAFTNLTENEVTNGVASVTVTLEAKTIEIQLLKPYILSAGQMGDQVTPSTYINYLFSEIRITFADDSYDNFCLENALPADFDERAFTYGNKQSKSLVSFLVPRLSGGTRTENFMVNVYTIKDELKSTTLSESVETFEPNGGTPIYTAGYDLPSQIEVEYKYSGKVTYSGIIWYARSALTDDAGFSVGINQPIPDQNIPSSMFKTLTGNTIWLYTKLTGVNSVEISKTYTFYSKNIKETLYNAEASNAYYSIRTGAININNIYNVYPFDVSALPTTIVPHTGTANSAYQIEEVIRFGVTWVPTAQFAKDNDPTAFDQEKINNFFNYNGFGGSAEEVFATAEIRMYGQEVQIIKLYVNVAPLADGQISYSKLNVTSEMGNIAGEVNGVMRNSTVIDPYENNFGGNFVLPHDITVTFGSEVYTFAKTADIKYQIKNKAGVYVDIVSIPYTHLGHNLGADYGAATDTLYLHVILPDSQVLYLDIKFNSRELQTISLANKATKVEGGSTLLNAVYYIDPYDEATYQVPMHATFGFLVGDDSELDISYWTITNNGAPFDANYRFKATSEFYKGGNYTFKSSLAGYGVKEQEFQINVIVLDRSLIERPASNTTTPYINTYYIDNPVAMLASGIPASLSASSFVSLDSAIYDEYNAISAPVMPAISWNIKNDDIVYDGINEGKNNNKFTGNVKFGNIAGEITAITLSAPKWTFYKIIDPDVNSDEDGVSGNIINFNTYTSQSVASVIHVQFYVNDNMGQTRDIEFYPTEHVNGDTIKSCSIIDWGDLTYNDTKLRTFTLGNAYKSLKITVDRRYLYRFTQIPVTEINFGYGYAASNYVELVIDPLNPNVPSEVLARGKEPGVESSEYYNLGYIPVSWEASIYEMDYKGTTVAKDVEATLTTTTGDSVKFNVKVYYLDRTPLSVKTTTSGFSKGIASGGMYTLLEYNSSTASYASFFQIDPTANATYDAASNKYLLPEDLIFTFKSSSAYSNATLQTAAELLGNTFTYTNITWKLSRAITLKGTDITNENGVVIGSDPIITTITQGDLSYVENPSADNRTTIHCGTKHYPNGMDELYDIELNVINREVEYTSVSEKIVAKDGTTYQRALSQYYIDPYEEGYLSSFPTEIIVKYTGAQEQKITIEEWIFNEEYLKRPDVISGKIKENGGTEESMTVMAEIKVFGTSIAIQFRIKARNIITTTEDGEGTMPMAGGTIFVLKGMELRPQLPTYMYYRFEYEEDGMNITDVTKVPLTFTDNNLYGVSTERAGVSYTVLGTLGGINVDNIEFTVTVIDPQVYATIDAGESVLKGSFLYDYIEVARNTAGFYTVGKEATLLPKIIYVTDNGDYLMVQNVEYTMSFDEFGKDTGYATFYCKYIFNRDANDALSGNATGEGDDAARLAISFTVPVRSYDYTIVDSTTPLTFNTTEYVVALGSIIKASDMPCALDVDGNEYRLIWDMSRVQTNTAGEYVAYGYYLNNAAKNNVVSVNIIVKQQQAFASDFAISKDWTERVYSGKIVDVDNYLTISTFLRSDGTIDKVEGYTLEYSVDNGISWQLAQPIRVGSYLIKITIQDYNIFGYAIIGFNISKAEFKKDSVTFHEVEDGPEIHEDGAIVYSYTGDELSPVIKGLLEDVNFEYDITYEKRGSWDSSIGAYTYTKATPINVGIYRLTISFPEQRDYYSSQSYSIEYEIVAKNVVYSIQREMTYNGSERDVIVNGLPQNTMVAGVKVTYIYYDPADRTTPIIGKVKNAGTYLVTVIIDGGSNYPSANCNGVSAPNLTMIEFKILPKQVVINVNELESEYLEDIKPLYSAVTITDADNPEISGLQGADTINLFLNVLNVYCPDAGKNGVLTNRHMVNDRNEDGTGGYTLAVSKISAGNMPSNYIVADNGYIGGKYYITATNGAKVISNKLELDNALAQLRDNQEVKWYLRNGDYGSITINKNATVSIVGSYNLQTGDVAVDFTSINVVKGGVTIDIVNFKAMSRSASVSIGEEATSVTINRTNFIRTSSAYLTGSIAVASAPAFKGELTMRNSYVTGYTTAIYMRGGSLNLSSSVLDNNIIGVQVQGGDMVLLNNTFSYNRSEAVYNISASGAISINDNNFIGNSIAIKSLQTLLNDILVQNVFTSNAKNIYKME